MRASPRRSASARRPRRASRRKECSEVGDLDAEPERQPPDDVTIVDGAHVYESEEPLGKTERFLAAADGDAGEMEAKRDAAADALVSDGYKLLGTDQEEGAEAEAHLSGPHDGRHPGHAALRGEAADPVHSLMT